MTLFLAFGIIYQKWTKKTSLDTLARVSMKNGFVFFVLTMSASLLTALFVAAAYRMPRFINAITLSGLGLIISAFVFTAFEKAFSVMASLPYSFFLFYCVSLFVFTALFRLKKGLKMTFPFFELDNRKSHSNKILLHPSALDDERLIDFINTGILSGRFVVIRELESSLMQQAILYPDSEDVHRRRLAVLKKILHIPELELVSMASKGPPGIDLLYQHLLFAAENRMDLLASDLLDLADTEGKNVRVISLNQLAGAMKPLLSTGKTVSVKVQRPGKEQRQGIGYLEDGSMVVINDGADYIGATLDVSVISVKHSSTGRIIFTSPVLKAALRA